MLSMLLVWILSFCQTLSWQRFKSLSPCWLWWREPHHQLQHRWKEVAWSAWAEGNLSGRGEMWSSQMFQRCIWFGKAVKVFIFDSTCTVFGPLKWCRSLILCSGSSRNCQNWGGKGEFTSVTDPLLSSQIQKVHNKTPVWWKRLHCSWMWC